MSPDDPIWDDPFHAAAFTAFIAQAIEQQDWPDSELTRRRAYKLFEDAKKVDNPAASR